MDLNKKILKVINEDTLNALSFDDELPDTEDVRMHRISNDAVSDKLDNDLEKRHYLATILAILPDPTQIGTISKEQSIKFINTAKLYYKEYGFKYNPHLDEIKFLNFIINILEYLGNKADLNWIDTSEVTTMADLFAHSRFNGNISEWDTSNVVNMEGMFNENSVFNGDISNWDVSNVEDMSWMFAGAAIDSGSKNSLPTRFNGDLSKWNIRNLTIMYEMFYNSKFNNDSICNWDVSNIDDMRRMFECSDFDLDLSKWDVSNAETLGMFKFSKMIMPDKLPKGII